MNRWHDIFGQTPPSFRDRVHTTLLELEDNTMTQNSRKSKIGRKTVRTILLVAAAAALLMGTAYAAVSHSDFFRDAFGIGGYTQEATTVELTDEDGNVRTVNEYPAIERVEVDEDLAEELIGDNVATAGTSVTVGAGYTFTVCDYVIDENGIGVITVEVTNSDGLKLENSDIYYDSDWDFSSFYTFTFSDGVKDTGMFGEDGQMLDDRSYLTEDSTDTLARYVCYLTPFDTSSAGTDITLTIYAWTGECEEITAPAEDDEVHTEPVMETAKLVIPASEAVSAATLTGDTVTASVSPVGMTLTFPEDDTQPYIDEYGVTFVEQYNVTELVIHYTDGSEYVVKGDNIENVSVSSMQASHDEAFGDVGHQTNWYAFNRLVDVDSIESITFAGYHCPADPDGDIEDISETLLPAA